MKKPMQSSLFLESSGRYSRRFKRHHSASRLDMARQREASAKHNLKFVHPHSERVS
jgi:hypothetical protein